MNYQDTNDNMLMQNDIEKDIYENNKNRKYLDLDTFILCNPNAMSYQNMINYP